MKSTARILAAVLVAALLLSGCGISRSAAGLFSEVDHVVDPKPNGKPVPQEAMESEALDAAVKRLEYSAIAAAISAEDTRNFFENGYDIATTVHIADLDGDQEEELAFGYNGFVMDSSDGKQFHYYYSQSGSSYYTDRNGNFYMMTNMGSYYEYRRGYEYDPANNSDTMPLPDHLDSAMADAYINWYACWDGSAYVTRLTYDYESLSEFINSDYAVSDTPFYEYQSIELPSGEKLENEDAVAYREEIALQEVTTSAADYTITSFDSKYQESICQALDSYLRQDYSGFSGYITADVDSDGEAEQVFVIPAFIAPWESSLRQQEQEDMYMDINTYASHEFDLTKSRTAVLLADRQGDQVVFQAGCVIGDYYAGSDASAQLNGSCLTVDGVSYPLSCRFAGGTEAENLYPQLDTYLSSYGFHDPAFLRADLADHAGDELVCLCQKDGVWYILILCFEDDALTPLMQVDTSTTACYLTEVDGQDCLLTYSQNMYEDWSGSYSTNYQYRVLRFDAEGLEQSLGGEYLTVSASDQDATKLSNFMSALQTYLVKIVVVRDPFVLTGQAWPQSSDLDYGTPQADPTDNNEEDSTLGFVQIKDPSSWLNLREGPGTEYDRVLVDPSDPDSYVRQALGSPVTVLETIETGDPDNPVWVKIRIRYGDREFIGYSSKTFIRLQNEG